MLLIWRKAGESIWIGQTRIRLDKVTDGGKVRLAIEPECADVFIMRDELLKEKNAKLAKQ